MKRTLALLVTVVLVLSYGGLAHGRNPACKLGRGIANVATSPVEIFYSMERVSDEKGFIAGWTWGVVDGVFYTVRRLLVGVYEIVTFPFPVPADYEAVIDSPEFYMEHIK